MKKINAFKQWLKKNKRKKSDGSTETLNQLAQDSLRDWQTDAYRSQSAKREADVTPIQ